MRNQNCTDDSTVVQGDDHITTHGGVVTGIGGDAKVRCKGEVLLVHHAHQQAHDEVGQFSEGEPADCNGDGTTNVDDRHPHKKVDVNASTGSILKSTRKNTDPLPLSCVLPGNHNHNVAETLNLNSLMLSTHLGSVPYNRLSTLSEKNRQIDNITEGALDHVTQNVLPSKRDNTITGHLPLYTPLTFTSGCAHSIVQNAPITIKHKGPDLEASGGHDSNTHL